MRVPPAQASFRVHAAADGRGVSAQGLRRHLTHGHHPNGAGRDDEFEVPVSARNPAHDVVFSVVDMSRLTGVACWHRDLAENLLTGTIPTELAEMSNLDYL